MLHAPLPRLLHALLIAALLLAVPPLPAQAQSCFDDTYTVQLGDTLYSISKKCFVPYAALLGINVEISNPDKIYPGQVIRLVAGAPLKPNPVLGTAQAGGLQADGDYIARPGDSLARIAYIYNTTIAALLYMNPEIRPGGVISIGQRIHLPDGASTPKGWVGISSLFTRRYEELVVRVVDFPAYANLDLNLGELDTDGSMITYAVYEGVTDARGEAHISVKMPYFAWSGEEWIVEVVTTELSPSLRRLSPVITID